MQQQVHVVCNRVSGALGYKLELGIRAVRKSGAVVILYPFPAGSEPLALVETVGKMFPEGKVSLYSSIEAFCAVHAPQR